MLYGAAASATPLYTFSVFRNGPEMVLLIFSFLRKKICRLLICPGTAPSAGMSSSSQNVPQDTSAFVKNRKILVLIHG